MCVWCVIRRRLLLQLLLPVSCGQRPRNVSNLHSSSDLLADLSDLHLIEFPCIYICIYIYLYYKKAK